MTEETLVKDRNQILQLPLGGTREQGSHKGYGLALRAEILSTLLGGAMPAMLDPASGCKTHFAAYRIDAFTDLEQYMDTIDRMLAELRTAQPARGHERVLYPGLSEHEAVQERRANGISLHKEVITRFDQITQTLGLPSITSL